MDRDIRAAVYQELDADRLIDAADIVVEVVNGEVSLTGTVPSQDQRAAAATAARRVAGVTGVDNLLDVAVPSGDYLEDAALAQRVNGALAAKGVPGGVRGAQHHQPDRGPGRRVGATLDELPATARLLGQGGWAVAVNYLCSEAAAAPVVQTSPPLVAGLSLCKPTSPMPGS